MSAKQAIRTIAGAALVALGVVAAPASATFPGDNGQITFFRFDATDNSNEIWRADADGNPARGLAGRPVPQWTRPRVTPVEPLSRHGTTTDAPSPAASAPVAGSCEPRPSEPTR